MKEKIAELQTRTKKFALRIITLYSSLPKKTEAQVIGKQLLRSGTSVGVNYRESFRARSNPEFTAKVGICLSELEETSYWLELLIEANIVPSARLGLLLDECKQLIAIFVTIVKNVKKEF